MRRLLHLQRCELSRCSRWILKLAYYQALQRWSHGPNQLPTPYLCHIRHPRWVSHRRGPEFIATSTQEFLKTWRIHHRLSSVAYPHSNCRAEVGVKTVKRLITNNTSPNGTLDTDALQVAILKYRNTADPTTKLSPAECIFGRPIKDFIPITPGRYQPHPTWKDTLATREQALRNRRMRTAEQLSEHTRRLPPLKVEDQVRIQNQLGPHPKKLDKTGSVIEVRQFDQYVLRVDGSGRVTVRNRQFLRKFIPVHQRQPRRTITEDLRYLPTHHTTVPEHTTPQEPLTPTPHLTLH